MNRGAHIKPPSHIVTSCLVSIVVWAYFKSAKCAIVSFIAGVFIDLDHLIDYYSTHPFTLKIKDIYDACAEVNLKKIYLLFHSYELIILLWLAIYALSLSNIWKAMAIGLTQHLLFDQITNSLNTFGYFIIYRMIKGFKKELLMRKTKD